MDHWNMILKSRIKEMELQCVKQQLQASSSSSKKKKKRKKFWNRKKSIDMAANASLYDTNSKKRKVVNTELNNMKQNPALIADINEFVELYLIPKAGHFTSSKHIYDVFIEESHTGAEISQEKAFQMFLKKCVSAKFVDNSSIFASRVQQGGERVRGYTGLMLIPTASSTRINENKHQTSSTGTTKKKKKETGVYVIKVDRFPIQFLTTCNYSC